MLNSNKPCSKQTWSQKNKEIERRCCNKDENDEQILTKRKHLWKEEKKYPEFSYNEKFRFPVIGMIYTYEKKQKKKKMKRNLNRHDDKIYTINGLY